MRAAILALAPLGGCLQDPSLFIRLTGDGAGRVTSEPTGIDCGRTCGMLVDRMTSLTLTATPRTGSAFVGWSGGGCSGIEPCTPDLGVDVTIEATFSLATRELVIAKSGTGTGTVTSSPLGIMCGDDCSELYSMNTELVLTAAPDAGSRFVGWAGEDDCSTATPCTMLVDRDATVSALFESP